jgi:hypothetical protein
MTGFCETWYEQHTVGDLSISIFFNPPDIITNVKAIQTYEMEAI